MPIQTDLDLNVSNQNHEAQSRRRLLKAGLGACAMLALSMVAPAVSANINRRPFEKKISLLNLHTGERVHSVFWANGRYVPDSLHSIYKVLRDHRTGDRVPIDLDLLDTLYILQRKLQTKQEFHVISAYRSLQTNQKLAAQSDGVAKSSLHTLGKAIDIRLPGHRLNNVHKAALGLQMGGVGYYPGSNFVHIDTGRVRFWQG